MLGREREPIDWGPFLWPLFQLCMQVSMHVHPVETFLLAAAFLLFRKAFAWFHNWRMHWKVAALIADWHDAEVKKKMKAKGWRGGRRDPADRGAGALGTALRGGARDLPGGLPSLLPGLRPLLLPGALPHPLSGPVFPLTNTPKPLHLWQWRGRESMPGGS